MAEDWFDGWGVERALEILDTWPGASIRPAVRGPRKGQHLKYAACYGLDGPMPRELNINTRRAEQRGVVVSVNALSVDGKTFDAVAFPRVEVLSRRPTGSAGVNGSPGVRSSVNRNPSLKPRDHDVIELYVRDKETFISLLGWYGGRSIVSAEASPVAVSETPAEPPEVSPEKRARRSISLEELSQRLAANAETGLIGEQCAHASEIQRLASAGCPTPSACVEHTALKDVAAGYDIESRWNDDIRFIEVKSSRSDGEEFFLSENERSTLAGLGEQAWLYLVHVDGQGGAKVVERIRDPMAAFADDAFEPVVWRVRASGRR